MGRRLLFGILSAALVVTAVLVLSGLPARSSGSAVRSADAPSPSRSAEIYGEARSPVRGVSAPGAVRGPARRFVAAFLRFEVGERAPALVRVLRATSTPSFASELLRGPVGIPAGRAPAPAAVKGLSIRMVTARPPVALVSGVARRPGGVEQFSFLFVHAHSGWLARGPGE